MARALDAMLLRPYYPASDLFRLAHDETGLQVDFMVRLDGIRSSEALRARAVTAALGDATLFVADLDDIVRSKRAANRGIGPPSPSWRRRSVRRRGAARRVGGRRRALRHESERALREQIRRLLVKPMHERTHFLRARLPGGGSQV